MNVAVTGGSGNIAYALLFRIASGALLGPDQPVNLHLIDIPPMEKRLLGVKMELEDCAFPTLNKIITTSKLNVGFNNVDIAFLVGSRPRSKGMERADLLKVNGKIFVEQGKALGNHARRNCKVLVVGNPANTNCLIAVKNAEGLSGTNFAAMTRLDHNRAKAQLALKLGTHSSLITKMAIWGNHSPTMFSDLSNTLVDGKPAMSMVDRCWYEKVFNPKVGKRGAEVIKARGLSSAASAASAAVDCVRDWVNGSDDWNSMCVLTEGNEYGVPNDLVFSFPVMCKDGNRKIVEGLKFDTFGKMKMKKTIEELVNERKTIENLL